MKSQDPSASAISPPELLVAAMEQEADLPRSKLDPLAEVIWELRRRRKRLQAITTFLNERGVSVSRSTVGRWIQLHPAPKEAALPQRPSTTTTPTSVPKPSDSTRSAQTNSFTYNDDEEKRQTPVPTSSTPHKLRF